METDGKRGWRVRFVGPLGIERDGMPHRLRTRQQTLLVALLVARDGRPIDRGEAAGMLWPDADPADARTYLRRALMELRRAGIAVASGKAGLSIAPDTVESDLEDTVAERRLREPAGEAVIGEGWDDPAIHEIRALVQRRVQPIRTSPRRAGGSDPDREVLASIGQIFLDADPRRALELIARRRLDVFAHGGGKSLLKLLTRLIDAVPEPSESRIVVLCLAGNVARALTLYGLSDATYLQAIDQAAAMNETGLLAQAHAERSQLLIEMRDWPAAREAVARAVEMAESSGDTHAISVATGALARFQWMTGDYPGAARSFATAVTHAEREHERVPLLANASFLWGILGVDTSPALRREAGRKHTEGYYGGAATYTAFSLAFGEGRFDDAARAAAECLAITADEGLERFICVTLDCAAISFASLGMSGEAAASVRLSTRLRLQLGHPRAAMESDALRRHVRGGYFGDQARECERRWRSEDPAKIAYRVAARLRFAVGP